MKLKAASYSYLCGIVLLKVNNIDVILMTNVNIFRLFECVYMMSNMLYEYALNEAG